VTQHDVPAGHYHSLEGPPTTARQRIKAKVKHRIQQWVFGAESNFPGDPRRRLNSHPSSTTDMRLIQFTEDDGDPVTVGKYTGIHHSVTIFHGGMHRPNWVGVMHVQDDGHGGWMWPDGAMDSKGPVVIGNDVLVTFEALIMSGVTIGDGAIVMPRAVVVSDVAPFSIVGGNPAKHVRWRFDEETREALLRIKWWDWPAEKIRQHRHEIDSPDVAGFIERHDPLRNGGSTA